MVENNNKKMNKQIYRHGDLTLRPVSKIEGKEIKHNGSFVLAEGETTGHRHLLTAERMTIKQDTNGRYYLSLGSDGVITHEEHETITLPAGKYEVIHEREMDWFQRTVKRVVD